MHDNEHVRSDQPACGQGAGNWYGELCDILASERLLVIPDCEALLDRLARSCEILP